MKNILSKGEINHIDQICKQYKIENYTINPDGSIDVDGVVDLGHKRLNKLPLRFDKVSSSFYCGSNNLTSLEGCPSYVGGDFYCGSNNLTSLEGCSTSVGGYFYCNNNQLTSLKGCPKSIGGDFYCNKNQLTSLEGCPTSVGGHFSYYDNDLPQHFMKLYNKLSNEERKIIFKYQHDLRIWEDGYNEEAAQDLYEEIKDGMR